MNTTIQKWGNSQGLRIAKEVLAEAKLDVGDTMEIEVKPKVIILRKPARKKLSLAELVKKIPKGYKSKEYDWGKPMGKEVW
jgi:antitoxin MazE